MCIHRRPQLSQNIDTSERLVWQHLFLKRRQTLKLDRGGRLAQQRLFQVLVPLERLGLQLLHLELCSGENWCTCKCTLMMMMMMMMMICNPISTTLAACSCGVPVCNGSRGQGFKRIQVECP
jgi:hypothetical protein